MNHFSAVTDERGSESDLADSAELSAAIAGEIGSSLPPSVQQRLEVVQTLVRSQGSEQYGALQQQAAQTLGLSVRSVQRLLKAWREQGVSGLYPQTRSDRGGARMSEEWQKFIVKTYREGNRGSRQMSPAQVAVRVKVQAQKLGVDTYPSHMSVYRLLNPLIEKRKQQKRSILRRNPAGSAGKGHA